MFWNYENMKNDIFQSISYLKIVILLWTTYVYGFAIELLNVIKKLYLTRKKPKIKKSTLRNTEGLYDLTDTDIL